MLVPNLEMTCSDSRGKVFRERNSPTTSSAVPYAAAVSIASTPFCVA